jgi:CRP-like cAMP-binding protein
MAEKMTALEGQLKDFAMLSCLDDNGLKDFISCAVMKEFPPDYTILRVDTPGKNLFILLSGRVVLLDRQGETIGHLDKGEIFGEMSLMFNRLINVTVKSVGPVKVLIVNGQDFNHLLLKFPFVKMELARLIAKRLSNSNVPASRQQPAGLNGRLKELPAPELFQMIHENMKNGTVELTLPGGSASVEFVKGEIVDSKYHGKTGKEAFYSIIMEREGSFIFNNSPPTSDQKRQPLGGFMSILMEGLRLLDEKESADSRQHSNVAQTSATEQ